MAGRFVRGSKLRNVYGSAFKKDQCYESVRVSNHNNVAMFCAANPKFVAVVTQAAGGGSFLVLPLSKTGRVDVNSPQVTGHKAPVIDIAWSPFDDSLVASGDESGSIMVWQIPDGGLTENMDNPLTCLAYHQKRIVLIKWHPTIENVLLSSGLDGKIVIWDLDEGDIITEVTFPDVIQDVCWNYDGSAFGCVCKDKKVRICNSLTGCIEKEFTGHDSHREQRLVILKNNRIFTTGFTKMSTREYRLWDPNNLEKPIVDEQLDNANGPLNIFYDPDLSMVYLVGKGDSVIRYYEETAEAPYFHYITTYQSNQAQRGMGFMTKRGCNVNLCEVARLYKIAALKTPSLATIEPISFIVPRKSELYQSDVYPDTASNDPSVSISEWRGGASCAPKMMDMKQFYVEKETAKTGGFGGLKKKQKRETTTEQSASESHQAERPAKPSPSASVKAPTPVVNSSKGQSQQIDDLIAEIAKLKATVAEQEKRIEALEAAQ